MRHESGGGKMPQQLVELVVRARVEIDFGRVLVCG